MGKRSVRNIPVFLVSLFENGIDKALTNHFLMKMKNSGQNLNLSYYLSFCSDNMNLFLFSFHVNRGVYIYFKESRTTICEIV